MTNIKRFFSLALMAFIFASAIAAQDAGGRTSDGGTQRQNSLDLSTLRDNGPDDLNRRNNILKYTGEAIANGDTGDDIYAVLEYMSKEGLSNKTYRNSLVVNNFPTVRRQVAEQLGRMNTARATDILIQLCRNERDDFNVQLAAVNALGNIGINENGYTVDAIFIIPLLRRYKAQSTSDDNYKRLVSSAVEAFDKIDKKSNGLGNRTDTVYEFLDYISKLHFAKGQDQIPLHERAKQVLDDILKREAQRK
jgi:hypothetical protein